jgi:hypothetical protein
MLHQFACGMCMRFCFRSCRLALVCIGQVSLGPEWRYEMSLEKGKGLFKCVLGANVMCTGRQIVKVLRR